MPKSPKQKQKLLYLAKYLMQKTDEQHAVTTPQLIEYLAANDISAERKSIYDDIETLCNFGMDIVRQSGPKGGYFLASRDFELAEVKLLVDLVQSAKFITQKKSHDLIHKLEQQVSTFDAKTLQRQVVVADRNKTENETIYYSVDVIYEAIAKDIKVRYQYFEWDIKKEMSLRKGGAYYEVSPWLLTWDDENYYLVAYDEKAGMMKHYRVDKMLHIELMEENRQGRELFEQMDVAAFSKKTFGMFAGKEETVQLICENGLIGVLVDRFGRNVPMRAWDEEHVLVRANVQVSSQFFGWLAGFSNRVRIHTPEHLKQEYREYLVKILDVYSDIDSEN